MWIRLPSVSAVILVTNSQFLTHGRWLFFFFELLQPILYRVPKFVPTCVKRVNFVKNFWHFLISSVSWYCIAYLRPLYRRHFHEGVPVARPFKKFLAFNPLNPELNPICYLLALLGAHYFLHVSRIRVKLLTFRLLMSYIYIYIYIYIYGAPILDVSRSHTTTQHGR